MRRGMLTGCLGFGLAAVSVTAQETAVTEVLFSPAGGCTRAVVQAIEQARTSVHVQARVFTSPAIAKALADARRREVDVVVLLDRAATRDGKCVAPALMNQQVKVLVDTRHKASESRNIIIDDATVLTGSFDLSPEAELTHAGTLVILRNQKELAARFAEHFRKCMEGAEEYRYVADKSAATAPASARKSEGKAEAGAGEQAGGAGKSGGKKAAMPAGTRLDPNKASREELVSLPGIGPALADRIIAYRELHGKDGPAFRSLSDLRKVRGIGEKTAAGLAPHLTFPGDHDDHDDHDDQPDDGDGTAGDDASK